MDVTRAQMSSSLLFPFLPANALDRCAVGALRKCPGPSRPQPVITAASF
jgi:hypothetical protein